MCLLPCSSFWNLYPDFPLCFSLGHELRDLEVQERASMAFIQTLIQNNLGECPSEAISCVEMTKNEIDPPTSHSDSCVALSYVSHKIRGPIHDEAIPRTLCTLRVVESSLRSWTSSPPRIRVEVEVLESCRAESVEQPLYVILSNFCFLKFSSHMLMMCNVDFLL